VDPLFELIRRLADRGVDYVVTGCMAGVVHGSPVVSPDMDVYTPLDEHNLAAMLAVLRDCGARLKTDRGEVPLPQDRAGLGDARSFTVVTDGGLLNVFGELPGADSMQALEGRIELVDVGGFICRVLDLETLIAVTAASTTPRDEFSLLHLRAVRSRRQKRPATAAATDR
jgi:hypothetical protein